MKTVDYKKLVLGLLAVVTTSILVNWILSQLDAPNYVVVATTVFIGFVGGFLLPNPFNRKSGS